MRCLINLLCPRFFAVCLSIVFLGAVLPTARAAPPKDMDAAFIQTWLTTPVWSQDALEISLRPDEARCRKAYGAHWHERCFAAPGIPGEPAAGVVLSSAKGKLPRGVWRWKAYDTLAFTPESPWPAQTEYAVDLSKLPLPARMALDKKTLAFATLPLAGQSGKGEVWIDPNLDLGRTGQRAVSFALRFTTPPDRGIEQRMELKAPGLTLGKTEVVWAQDGASCVVKVPLSALPAKDTRLDLTVRGIRPLAVEGGVKLLPGDMRQSVTVPGKGSVFQIRDPKLTLERTGSLTQEYHLTFHTSLRVPAADVLKALKVVELSRLQNPEATVPYRWTSAPAITAEDLHKARPLKVALVKDPGQSGEPFVVRVPAATGSYIYCQLPAGFGPQGHTLAAPWTAVFPAPDNESSVHFLQPGHVLVLSPDGDNRLDIMASGVDSVRWRAARIRTESINLLDAFTSSYDRFALYDGVDRIATVLEGRIDLSGTKGDTLTPQFSTLPLAELMRDGTGLLQVELTGLREGKEVATARRLLLATDLGMVSKVAPDGTRQVFVCSLSGGTPVQGAAVRILGANGQPVAEARTDAAGQATLPAVRGLTREKAPVALVAVLARQGQKSGAGEDVAWMSLDDPSRRLDYSRFPTQGQISSPGNINAYVFGQRGIFRPGETLRFGLIVRRGDWKALPQDMPLVATLTDPAGRVTLRRTLTVAQGLAEVSWQCPENAPTGRYRLDIATPASADIIGSGAVRVEEFQPDTLAIRADLLAPALKPAVQAGHSASQVIEPKGWLVTPQAGHEAALAVYLRNFYGMPAEGRKVRAELTVSPASLSFPGFEDFTFPDMLPLTTAGEAGTATVLPESLTTEGGEARVGLPLSAYQSRTLLCRVLVEGFEPDGGRAVSTEKRFLVSPLPVMLGYRPSGAVGSLDYVPQGTRGGLEMVALGPDLRPADPGPLRLSVAERRYRTVLATDAQGRYVYEETPVDTEVSGATVKTDAATGRLEWAMPTDKPGEFLLTVRAGDRVLARVPFTVAGNDDVRLALAEDAKNLPSTQLRLRLDKTAYAPGGTVQVFLAAPYDGVGLMTLERDRVASHVWFRAKAGHSVQTLTIPKDFEGRGYINVTMGRALSSPEIFMQPHSFAVAPLTVNVAERDMGLKIDAPQRVLPGGTVTARVTSRHAGKALIFAVDEGVLQLTRFATPDPLRYLLLDRALEVHTEQIFDLLMPAHAQLGKRLPAFGGDMASPGGRFHNPFKRRNEPPLAWWSGVVDVSPQGTTVDIPVPAYTNSEVRIMAVAVSPATAGAAEARTVSRAPLVITPQMPLVAAPGDSFEGGVGLHNTTDTPLPLRLAVENASLGMEQSLPESVEVPAGKEIFLPLRCTAPETPGEASLTVLAHAALPASAGQQAPEQEFRRSVSLSVRPAVLPRQDMRTGWVQNGAVPQLDAPRALYPFKAGATASVSAAPLPPLRALLGQLASYPYACVEQSLSRALPLVLLQRRQGMAELLTPPVINGKPRAEVHAQTLEQALAALRAAFRDGAGVAPWPDAQYTDLFLTAYAGDFLLSLREAGLSIPGDLSTDFFNTLQLAVDRTPDSLHAARAQAYGLWVLTRHGVITSQALQRLWETLNERWQDWETDVTASLMAGSFALMNMHEQAERLLQGNMPGLSGGLAESGTSGALDVLGARSLYVAVLARHFPQHLRNNAETLSALLVEKTRADSGTLSAALGTRALLELAFAPWATQQTGAPEKPKPSSAQAASPGRATPAAAAALAGLELRCASYQPGFAPAAPDSAAVSTAGTDLPGLLHLSAPGCTAFTLHGAVKAPLYWDVSTDGYDRELPAAPVSNGMEVTRVLLLPDGSVLESGLAVAQGTVLRVELSAQVYGAAQNTLTPVVLADLLPGGFEPVLHHADDALPTDAKPAGGPRGNAAQDNAVEEVDGTGQSPAGAGNYTRLDRREDRVIAYTSAASAPVTFVYHIRAVNRGRYVLPAVYGEGLYNRALNAHSAAGVIVVQ